jgi:hypothetical protein
VPATPDEALAFRALATNRNQDALSAVGSPYNLEGQCSFRLMTVLEAVQIAVAGRWDVPEFQRAFVWKPSQVCALADSLWCDYPIGSLLLWQTKENNDINAPLWIADGQQRLTSLCLLHGREPSWFLRKSDKLRASVRNRFDIRLELSAGTGPHFMNLRQSRHDRSDPRFIPTDRLLSLDPDSSSSRKELELILRELKRAGYGTGLDEAELYSRLLRATMIRHRKIVAVTVTHPTRAEILDIFQRLNSRGMGFRRLLLRIAMEEIPAAIRGMKGRYQS